MPLINGQKMACEPCIRGHRSTKCNHANDRLMVPVRKPGRPLSSCPHPASRPCSCASVTAAIPKKQKCRCGPSSISQSSSSSDVVKDELEPATPPLPTSPRRCSVGTSYKVQKQKPKTVSRKQSIDVASLEKMDLNQINIMRAFDVVRAPNLDGTNGINGHAPVNDLNPYTTINAPVKAASFGSSTTIYPMLQQPIAAPFAPEINDKLKGKTKPLEGGDAASAAHGCCGRKSTSQNASHSKTESPKAGKRKASGSCCSSKPSGVGRDAPPSPAKVNGQVNETALPMFEAPMTMNNNTYPFFATPNIFNYPPQYGSYMQPLQPKQWRQVMSSMNMSPPVQEAYMYGGQSALLYQNGGGAANSANPATWTSHQCTCGDSCQCIGCAAHPYNDATQDYVRSAWNVMMQDSQNGHPHGSSSSSTANGTHEAANEQTSPANGTAAATAVHGEGGTISPTAPQTPSDAASVSAEEQALSASDFFFVSYPFTEGCGGDMSICPCGDDCQCIGCTIHNNTGPDHFESLLATTR